MTCPHCQRPAEDEIKNWCDESITNEYYRRIRDKKAKSVALGGKTGGWPKGKTRKVNVEEGR